MAEYFARQFVSEKYLNNVCIESRALTNVYEPENSEASALGIEILKNQYNLDMSRHRSRLISVEDIRNASLVRYSLFI